MSGCSREKHCCIDGRDFLPGGAGFTGTACNSLAAHATGRSCRPTTRPAYLTIVRFGLLPWTAGSRLFSSILRNTLYLIAACLRGAEKSLSSCCLFPASCCSINITATGSATASSASCFALAAGSFESLVLLSSVIVSQPYRFSYPFRNRRSVYYLRSAQGKVLVLLLRTAQS
jgi:hypothetical protein